MEHLVEAEDEGDEVQSCLDAMQTERPLPFLRRDEEGGEEGSEVGREHYKCGPGVGFARVFV